MAIPTNTYDHVHFQPPLPPAKRVLMSRTLPGIYAKVILRYARPWWKAVGLVGKFSSLKGPVCFSWDMPRNSTKQYSLGIFVAGKIATNWYRLSELSCQEAITNHLADLVGPENRNLALDVLEVNSVAWTEEDFLFGTSTSVMGPKQLSQYGTVLRQPFLNVHCGGGEAAYEWKSYLDGAITAGESC